jgi:hypothetical protein
VGTVDFRGTVKEWRKNSVFWLRAGKCRKMLRERELGPRKRIGHNQAKDRKKRVPSVFLGGGAILKTTWPSTPLKTVEYAKEFFGKRGDSGGEKDLAHDNGFWQVGPKLFWRLSINSCLFVDPAVVAGPRALFCAHKKNLSRKVGVCRAQQAHQAQQAQQAQQAHQAQQAQYLDLRWVLVFLFCSSEQYQENSD